MPTIMPAREDLYFHNGAFHAKSKWSKRFKRGFIICILASGIFTTLSIANIQPLKVGMSGVKYPIEQVALIDYVAKFNKEEAKEIVAAAVKWGKEFELDPKLVIAISQVESTFNKFAISPTGAFGLMQVIPSWHREKIVKARSDVGSPELFAIDTNIYLGSWVFKDCLDRFKLTDKSLRCYNGSIGQDTNYDDKVLARYNDIKKFVKENT